MKNKILYYALEPTDPTSFYRIAGVLPYLDNSKFELVDISNEVNFSWATFASAAIFIFQRPFDEQHLDILKLAKISRCKTIVDYDDDLLHVDQYNSTCGLYAANREVIMDILHEADEIWVSTQGIYKSFEPFNDNIFIIPNAHNDYLFPVENKKQHANNQKVFWRGGGSHEGDVYGVAEEMLKLINGNGDYAFCFLGHRFIYLEQRCGENYYFVDTISVLEYFAFLHEQNPQIMMFPLRESTFNQGKSNISWLEATYAGAAFFGNVALPEFQMPGISDMGKLFASVNLDNEFRYMNNVSWAYIQEHLLLSQINKLRENRILANL